jgi:hypothetical protein
VLALYLLAAHLVGDFVLQNRWQAVGKLADWRVRTQHVVAYSIPFWPIAAVYGNHPWWHGMAFLFGLYELHYLTDSHRFRSTLGDVVQWWLDWRVDPIHAKREWLEHAIGRETTSLRAIDLDDQAVRWPTPNPWPAAPLMIDQALHVCQLALLGGILLG